MGIIPHPDEIEEIREIREIRERYLILS